MSHPSFGKFETVTGGDYSSVTLTDTGIEYEDASVRGSYVLPSESLQICSFLLEHANEPFLPTEIKRDSPDFEGSVSDAFGGIIKSIGNTILGGHFIRLGRSSATWYGFVDDDSIDSRLKFADIGLTKIDMDAMVYGHDDRTIARRQKPFLAYKKYLSEGEKGPFFTKNKKLAGAAALSFTVGAITIYVTRHFKHS